MTKKKIEIEKGKPIEGKQAPFVEIDITTDEYSAEEQAAIVEMIKQDIEADGKVMSEWKEKRKVDIQHYECEKPSIIESLNKKGWMSDRNLGLCPAVVDTYQSTLLATCWNPDSIHFVATEKNDVDNKDNLERFTKWVVGKDESDVYPEIDDFIHNKEVLGFSCFWIYWKVWYEWVDKRIWNDKTKTYDIKTDEVRFEKGCMENISNLEDLLMPRYGKNIQELPHLIHIRHIYGYDLLQGQERGVYMNVDEQWVEQAKELVLASKRQKESKSEKQTEDTLGIKPITDDELRSLPVDIYVWYGQYEKNGKRERYRFIIEPISKTFLSGKPLRKVNRSGKYPFVGGPFIKRPGFIWGISLPTLIAPIVNSFNNIYNMTSDSQYVSNCPFGFYKPDENFIQQKFDLEPGALYPAEDPGEVNFPNLQRSYVWSAQHIQILFEVLEKLTGASSYFTTSGKKTTAKQQEIMEEKGTVRFGLWVGRIQDEICEAITMLIQLYQDWAPPKLGERVLGEDGRQMFQCLSIESLRGAYGARMSPDRTNGSKSYEKQMFQWGIATLAQSPWMDIRINPKGNYKLLSDTMKAMGYPAPGRYLPPEPKNSKGDTQEVKDEWAKFARGEKIAQPPEGVSSLVVEHLAGHMKQKEEKYDELDEEYKANFDQHLFATQVNYRKFLAKVQQEKQAEMLAQSMIQMRGNLGLEPKPEQEQPNKEMPSGEMNG